MTPERKSLTRAASPTVDVDAPKPELIPKVTPKPTTLYDLERAAKIVAKLIVDCEEEKHMVRMAMAVFMAGHPRARMATLNKNAHFRQLSDENDRTLELGRALRTLQEGNAERLVEFKARAWAAEFFARQAQQQQQAQAEPLTPAQAEPLTPVRKIG